MANWGETAANAFANAYGNARQMNFEQMRQQQQNAIAQQQMAIQQRQADLGTLTTSAFMGITPDKLTSLLSSFGKQSSPQLMAQQASQIPVSPPPNGAMMSMPNGQYGNINGVPMGTIQAPQNINTNPSVPSASDLFEQFRNKLSGMNFMPTIGKNGQITLAPSRYSMTSKDLDTTANGLLNGSIVPSQLQGFQRSQAIAEAQRRDPTYNAAKADVNYSAGKMGAQQVEKMYNTVSASHDVFRKNADYLLEESDKLDRSTIPLLNKAILAGETNITGNPQASRYLAAVNTVASEYARLTNSPGAPTNVISDSARHEAQNILSSLSNPAQLHALLDRGTGIMDKDAYSKVRAWADKKDDYSGGSTSNSKQKESSNSTGDPMGLR